MSEIQIPHQGECHGPENLHEEGGPSLWWRVIYDILLRLNRLVCLTMYHVTGQTLPLPPEYTPVLLASNHTSYNDSMVLLAMSPRPITFVMARDVYDQSWLRWVFHAAGCIPVRRGRSDIGALRAMLTALGHGHVLSLFPEGGIVDHWRMGHPGIGYLALKTGISVIPVSITWSKPRPSTLFASLVTPGHAVIRYGPPLTFEIDSNPDHEKIRAITATIMTAIQRTSQAKA